MSEPTNKDLAEEIKKLSAELGVEVSPASSKAKLLEQLEQLHKQRAERAAAPLGGGAQPATASTASSSAAPADTGSSDGETPPATVDVSPSAELDASRRAAPDASDASQLEARQLATAEAPEAHRSEAVARRRETHDDPALVAELERLAEEDEELVFHIRQMLQDFSPVAAQAAEREAGILGEALRDSAQAFLRSVAHRLEALALPEVVRALRGCADALDATRKHHVAPGRSLSSPRRGVLAPGTLVDEHDVPGGPEAVEALVARGVLVRS